MLTSPVSLHSLGELGFTRMFAGQETKNICSTHVEQMLGEEGGICQRSYCDIHCCCLAPCVSAAGLCRASLGDFPVSETAHPESGPCSHLRIKNTLVRCHLLLH